jgi:hypothetical protein
VKLRAETVHNLVRVRIGRGPSEVCPYNGYSISDPPGFVGCDGLVCRLVFVTIPERGESAIILFSFEIGHTWQADRVIMEPSRPSDVEPCIREFIVRQRVIGEPPDLIQNTRAARAEIGQLTGDIARPSRQAPLYEWRVIRPEVVRFSKSLNEPARIHRSLPYRLQAR